MRSVLSPKHDPSPSQADIQMTKAIVDIAAPARRLRARLHHRREKRACEPEGLAADLASVTDLIDGDQTCG